VNYFTKIFLFFFVYSSIFAPVMSAPQLAFPGEDVIAPRVIHEPITVFMTAQEPHAITAQVTDNIGIKSVALFYRRTGDIPYNRISMENLTGTEIYEVILPGETMIAPGIEYYIEAKDTSGNTLLRGFSFEPLAITLAAPETDRLGNQTLVQSEAVKGTTVEKDSSNDKKWIYILLGVLAVGAIAGASGGGDGDSSSASVSLTADAPCMNFYIKYHLGRSDA
jgi:hypothetical protein